MHQEKLVGKINEEARTALETLEATKRRDEAGAKLAELECKLALERARLSPMPPIVLTEEQAKSAGLPSVLGLLGKHAWTLKCLTDDVRSLSKMLYGEQRANATLALRHLEDALHRLMQLP